jgi:hypothetical protein
VVPLELRIGVAAVVVVLVRHLLVVLVVLGLLLFVT